MPPKINILRALGCIADNRIKIRGGTATVVSSSRKNTYAVSYDSKTNVIASDDRYSKRGILGYPPIAYLMLEDKLSYDDRIALGFHGIGWDDLIEKYENSQKVEEAVKRTASMKGVGRITLDSFTEKVLTQIRRLRLIQP